jgi:hypothetical protein
MNDGHRFSTPIPLLCSALVLLLLSSCVTWTPRSQRTSPGATVIDRMPMQKWGIESCGAGSLSTVLQHYGDTTSMQQWDAELPKTRGGVMTVDMLIAARRKGFDAKIVTGNRATVEKELREGRPVILMLQVVDSPGRGYDFFHYVVADGIDPARGLIRTQFGDGKARWVTFEKIEKPWAGGGHAAIFIRPQSFEEAMRAAVALEEDGKYDAAAERYRSLTATHPDSVLAWTNLGNAATHLGDTKEAAAAFRKAIALDPQARDALNNLAWLLYEEKQYAEAESLARRALGVPGADSYLILDTLGRILAARGRCADAAAAFREALAAVPATRAAERTQIESGMSEAARNCRPERPAA